MTISIIKGPPGPRGEVGQTGNTGATGAAGPAYPKVVTATSLGIYHSTETSGPAPGGWSGLTAAQQAALNSVAIEAWQSDSSYNQSTLLFDGIGTYFFEADSILIPAQRKLEGVRKEAVTLKLAGASGNFFIKANGTPCYVEELNLHGGGTNILGSDALCHTICDTAGTLSPNVAGPTMYLKDVVMSHARQYGIHGRNAALGIKNVTVGQIGEVGLWSEGCSECTAEDLHISGNAGQNIIEHCVLLEGLYNNPNNRAGVNLTNGGLWRMKNVVTANCQNGITWNGVGGGGCEEATCEGSSLYSYQFIKSTGISVIEARCNAGNYALFDGSIGIWIQGFCVSTAHLEYHNNAANVTAQISVESIAADVLIEHWFGASSPWKAYRRPDGRTVSIANTAPTNGIWKEGDIVWRRTSTATEPEFWRCSVAGTPGTWVEGPAQPA